MSTENNLWEGAEVISSYTRAQALEDGFLCDVTKEAKEAGFRWPVALTSNVYERCVKVPEGVSMQDASGRLWDILTVLRFAIKQSADPSLVTFTVRVRNHNRAQLKRSDDVTLWATAGPGDNGEPVITIMFPEDY